MDKQIAVLRLIHMEGRRYGASCVYELKDTVAWIEELSELQHCDAPDKWLISIEEMREKDFKELPEFMGW